MSRTASNEDNGAPPLEKITSKKALKQFLLQIRDKMSEEEGCPAIFALSALNYVLSLENVYTILNEENKELARDIWLRLERSGLELKSPPVLFGHAEVVEST